MAQLSPYKGSFKYILLSLVEVCELVATNEDVNDPNRCFEMPSNISGGVNVFSVYVEPECLQTSSVVLLVNLGDSASGHLCQDLYWMLFYKVNECLGAKTCDVINPTSAATAGCRFQCPCEQQNGCTIGFFYGSAETAFIPGLKICSVKVAG